MNELDEQKRICDDIISQVPHAMAFKTSNRFMAGVPDLYISTNEHGTAWLEVKVEKWPRNTKGRILVDLTALQRNFLRKLQRSGANAGWAVIVPRPENGERGLYIGTNVDQTHVHMLDSSSTIRTKGGRWSVDFIMGNLT